jgi:hypothetical protein
MHPVTYVNYQAHLHFQGTPVNFAGFLNVSLYTISHGAPNYRKILYPENAKSQVF